jgi:molecular chaperone DnaK
MASLTATDLNKVILVGGATYMPLVAHMLEKELRIVPQSGIDPSLVVAAGASIEAANLSGQSIGPRMVDITPHSLGTGSLDENDQLKNVILIRRNTPIPCSASRIFYKAYRDQSRVEITVYQGESTEIHNNRFLGKFLLEDLASSQERDIHIKFHLDKNGLVHVTATDVSSGKQANQTLKRISHSRKKMANLAEIESVHIHAETKEADGLESFDLNDDVEEDEEAETTQEDQHLLQQAETLLNEGNLDDADKEELMHTLTVARTGDPSAMKKLSELMYYIA